MSRFTQQNPSVKKLGLETRYHIIWQENQETEWKSGELMESLNMECLDSQADCPVQNSEFTPCLYFLQTTS